MGRVALNLSEWAGIHLSTKVILITLGLDHTEAV